MFSRWQILIEKIEHVYILWLETCTLLVTILPAMEKTFSVDTVGFKTAS